MLIRIGHALCFIACFVAALAALPVAAPPASVAPADMVLHNGKIVTLDRAHPQVEALAARGDTIVALGSNRQIDTHIGPSTVVIDLQGKLAIPGFIEGHGHFVGIGQAKLNLDLMGARSWDEVVARVAAAVKKSKAGEWILGRGWHQEKWDAAPSPSVEGFPTHIALSEVSPNNPVLLTHASGHAGFANARALDLAGIDRDTSNPSGGEILRDARGEPTGLLRETAQALVRQALARDRAKRSGAELEAETRTAIGLATQECLSKGITSFQDAGSSFETIDLLRKLVEERRLGLRLWVMIRARSDELSKKLAHYRIINLGDKRLTVRAIKHSIDGALGPRGAWLLEPYSDLPGNSGLNTTPVEVIAETARLALQHDLQLCVHAIGDRANRETLDLIEKSFMANPKSKDRRWRIEHAQHLHPDDIGRFGRLGVIASMQAIHCTSDAPFVVRRLGRKRAAEGAYVWQKLIKSKAVVTNGTDAPVEDVSPIASFYAAVTRKVKDGSQFYPDQRMSRQQALRSYTLDCAYAAFEENIKGSLTSGKLADITVLSKDILTIPEDEIPATVVLYTIVGGKVVYQK